VEDLPMTFSYRQAREWGVSKRRLYGWRDEGLVELVGRGLYRRADAVLADVDLVEVAFRAREATLCLTSALVWHGLSDAIAGWHDVAVPRGRRTPVVGAPVRWHRFDPGSFAVGREVLALDGETSIGLYGAARSIVDVFRLASSEGPEVGYEALRRWLRGGGQPTELLAVAEHFPRTVARVRLALEVLL
jgi:hypothetical protein